jgi:AGZA family xanthine/uracil permease-like MFS transporter
MLDGLKAIAWDDYAILISAFLAVIMMPLTFSIANGVSFGVISYALIKLIGGKGKEVDPLLYLVAALLVARYVWLSG